MRSNVRNLAPPPHSGPLLTQTFDFLRSLTDPTSGPPEFALRPLIAQYLEDTPLPNFAGSDALIKSGESLSGHDEDTPSAQVTSEVDELIMHMSVADDGQVRSLLPMQAIYVDNRSRTATLVSPRSSGSHLPTRSWRDYVVKSRARGSRDPVVHLKTVPLRDMVGRATSP
jgi:hypothetical protein